VFERSEGEPASISLEHWALELQMPEDSLRKALSQLDEAGILRYLPPFRGRAIRLPERARTLSEILDFEALRRRKERDQERLNQVLRFAKSTACRQNAILRHFGEPVPPGGCGHCDGCGQRDGCGQGNAQSGGPRELDAREMTIVRKALSGIARAHGRCGKRRVIQMLRGSRSHGVSELGLDKLSTYGILSDHGRDDLGDLFDQLEANGLLRQAGDRYPVVFLTDHGVRVMKGNEPLKLDFPASLASRAATIGPKALRSARRGGSGDGSEARGGASEEVQECGGDAVGFDRELFEKLRRLRRQIAAELGVPAYRIFNDRTLKSMARRVPASEAELLSISGVGTVTLERFGKRFLSLLREEANGVGRG
jgi:ATP-dependent DNA helicase RecQ